MHAYASVSGGVIFVPEKIEQKTKTASYKDFVEEQAQATAIPSKFGRRSPENKKPLSKVA